MARRLVRPARSAYMVGDEVTCDGDYTGPYVGKVVAVHLDVSRESGQEKGPGVSVRCRISDGVDLELLEVPAHEWPVLVFNDVDVEPVSIPA